MQIKIKPAEYFTDILDSYVFRVINVDPDTSINKLMPCRHTSSIDFFLGDEYETTDLQTNSLIPFSRCTVRGPRTYKKYSIKLEGNFKSFSIRFKSTGIYKLLGIPMNNFTDKAIDGTLVNAKLFHEITSKLLECNNVNSCIEIVEPYLLEILHSHKPIRTTTETLAGSMDNSDNNTTHLFFCNSGLTPRQIERNFIKEIGINPKLYSSIIRFENVVNQKIHQPSKKWTELAYDNKFFDQMHMIKDFHRFLDIKPSEFSPSQFAF